MNKKIIVCSEEYTKEQFKEIEEYAAKLDVILRDIPFGSTDTTLVEDCDAMFGDFEEEMVLAAQKANWFQSSWDGADGLIKREPIASGRMVLTNAAGAYDTMIGEYLLGGVLALLHQFLPYKKYQEQGVWHPWIPAASISEKRITVLGCGRIGSTFARMAHNLGAHVTGVVRTARPAPDYLDGLFSIEDLDRLLPETDILVMMLPMAKDNYFLMDEKRLELLPRGAYILNAGRGKPLNAEYVGTLLNSGHLAGACLDVFPVEPLPAESTLWNAPNLLITPHVAGHTADPFNMKNILDIFRENLTLWAKGDPLKHVIDVEKWY